jgi:hypothetical protein
MTEGTEKRQEEIDSFECRREGFSNQKHPVPET